MPRRKRWEPNPEQNVFRAQEEHARFSDANANQRAEMALHLHVMGYTYQQIATKLGYANHTGAMKAVKRLRGRLPIIDAQEAIALQFMRIERGVLECMEYLEQQPAKDRLWALDRLVPLLKRQAELLGLDVKETAVTTPVIVELPVPLTQAIRGESIVPELPSGDSNAE